MHIVHVEDCFHPDFGYQLNLLSKYQVKQGNKVIIITARELFKNQVFKFADKNLDVKDAIFENKYGVKIIRLKSYGFISGRIIFSPFIVKFVLSLKPDAIMVHGNGTMTGIYFTICSFFIKQKLIFDCHMVDMATENKFSSIFNLLYRCIITPIIKFKKIQVIRTQNTNYLEKKLGIPLKQAPFISVGSDIDLFKPDKKIKFEFRTKYKLTDYFIVIYTGKLSKSKGCDTLLSIIKQFSQREEKIMFLVVGAATDSLGEHFLEEITKLKNVQYFKFCHYEELAQFYQASDIYLCPAQCSLSFYDAQSAGLPAILEDNDVNKTRYLSNNAILFASQNIQDLYEKILYLYTLEKNSFNAMSKSSRKYVIDNFSYEKITKQYTSKIFE